MSEEKKPRKKYEDTRINLSGHSVEEVLTEVLKVKPDGRKKRRRKEQTTETGPALERAAD